MLRVSVPGSRFPLRVMTVGLAIPLTLGLLLVAQSVRGQEGAPDTGTPVAGVASHTETDAMQGMDPDAGQVVVPRTPTDGVLTIVIPRGTGAAMQRNGVAGYHMPSVIRLQVGDTIVIRNDDEVPHLMLYTVLTPGQTHRRTFTTVGSEAYASGCAANAAAFPDFTTIFIVDR